MKTTITTTITIMIMIMKKIADMAKDFKIIEETVLDMRNAGKGKELILTQTWIIGKMKIWYRIHIGKKPRTAKSQGNILESSEFNRTSE
ncbi:MAG: hypothetical protein EZS28_005417 [Streblomastix strix]|uniref:Uncharacterized protein n=1 Tax=Streblomastix strix TaxID=222440 RepID=A0A5J4WVL9_9EUKA|nr:MAG: hypothetical protein EZS28_005417 [Streblomastix strix]